jgi:hypothetical protein
MKRLLWIIPVLVIGCPKPFPDPKPPQREDATCETACANAQKLWDKESGDEGCIVSQPTPRGASCVEVCKNTVLETGSYPLDCLVAATSCAEVAACSE